MSRALSVRTQFVIFAPIGAVPAPRGGAAPTSGLLPLLRALGVTDRAARFLQRWEPRAGAALTSGRNRLSPSPSFVEQVWMTLEYSAFPRLDTNLPPALLPYGWLGDRAADLAERYRKVLNPQAGAFFSRALEGAQGWAEWRGERHRALAA